MCYYTLQEEEVLASVPIDAHCHRLYIYGYHGYENNRFGCALLAYCPGQYANGRNIKLTTVIHIAYVIL